MHTAEQWLRHKPLLEQLYIDHGLSLSVIKCYMESEYGFSAKDFEYKLRFGKWKFVKNLKSEQKENMIREDEARRQHGMSPLPLHPKDKHKLKRHIRNQKRSNRQKSGPQDIIGREVARRSARPSSCVNAHEHDFDSSTPLDLSSLWISSCDEYVWQLRSFITAPRILQQLQQNGYVYVQWANVLSFNVTISTLHLLGYGDREYGNMSLNRTYHMICKLMRNDPSAIFVIIAFLQTLPVWRLSKKLHRRLLLLFWQQCHQLLGADHPLLSLLEAAANTGYVPEVSNLVQDAIVEIIIDAIGIERERMLWVVNPWIKTMSCTKFYAHKTFRLIEQQAQLLEQWATVKTTPMFAREIDCVPPEWMHRKPGVRLTNGDECSPTSMLTGVRMVVGSQWNQTLYKSWPVDPRAQLLF